VGQIPRQRHPAEKIGKVLPEPSLFTDRWQRSGMMGEVLFSHGAEGGNGCGQLFSGINLQESGEVGQLAIAAIDQRGSLRTDLGHLPVKKSA
jgi:hypothetical protein